MRKTKRKICIVTGSRAEYGLLYCLMREIKDDPSLVLQLVVTGMHLEPRFGSTYKQILKDGFKIDAKVKMDLEADSDHAITRAMGVGVDGLGKAYKDLDPNIVVILGDRFEMLAAASAALISRVPIAHIHGGELTEGAYDDSIRHAITKMALLHFPSHENYAKRIIQMGEDPQRVFCYGAPGLDRINRLKLLSQRHLEKEIGMKLGKDVALATFHPVTAEKGLAANHIKELIKALDKSGLRIIFTMPNADSENKSISREIERFVNKNRKKAKAFKSLGQLKYFSLLKNAGLMVGNSSSGVIEAASFRIPVVNIGSRQKGRIMPLNVINSGYEHTEIEAAIKKALSSKLIRKVASMSNPFGRKNISLRIKNKLKNFKLSSLRSKNFYIF